MKAARLWIKASLYWCSVPALLAGSPAAAAQPLERSAPSSNANASEELYRAGLELVRRARYSEACHKFAASWELAQTLENTLELAQCHKRLGRNASAWKRYRAAASLARARGEAQAETAARQAAEALEPELARITVDVSEARSPELQISRNGVRVPPELLGQPMPVDTGEHTIEATALGKKAWSMRVDVTTASSKTVVVPLLADAPGPISTQGWSPAPSTPSRDSERRDAYGGSGSWNVGKTLGVVGGAIGIAGTTWAVVHAIAFHNKKADHEQLQTTVRRCGQRSDPCEVGSQRYQEASRAYVQSRVVREDATRALYRSVAGAMVGASGFLVGAMFWFTVGQQHSGGRATLRVQPVASSRFEGISISGSW